MFYNWWAWFKGRGRRQSTTQDMNFDWTVISSGWILFPNKMYIMITDDP